MMASVSGILIFSVVPTPTLLVTSTVPPIFSTLVLTTSMPTPRPDTFVTFSAVLKPAAKIRLIASRSPMRAAASAVIRPFSTAFRFSRSGSMPAPSSTISMMTWPPSWNDRIDSSPSSGLPAARRRSGVSTPWSTLLRMMCVSGSLMASSTVRSSSVSLPSISRRTFLPQVLATSRTMRGNLFQRLPICCMRVFMTPSCSSVVIRFSRWAVRSRPASLELLMNCSTWLRVSTSSPTRFISLSSCTTSTRTALPASDSPALAAGPWSSAPAGWWASAWASGAWTSAAWAGAGGTSGAGARAAASRAASAAR